jgi:hypothetical protein
MRLVPEYSLSVQEKDNGIKGPRWFHHLFKAITGFLAWGLILLALLWTKPFDEQRASLCALGLSVVWFLSLRIAYFFDHRSEGATLFDLDFECDLALHLSLAGCGVIIWHIIAREHHGFLDAAFSLGYLALIGWTYKRTYPWAAP